MAVLDVSVIIPTFRRPALLAEAIASVRAQRGAKVELIVVDDSPEGSAAAVAGEFAHSVRYFRNPEPTGGFPSVVRNLGWPLARGRLVHFLDDDDLVPEGHYAAAVAAFEAHPDVGVVLAEVEPFGDGPGTQMLRERAFFRGAARRAAICSRVGPRLGFAAGMIFNQTLLVCGAALIRRHCVQRLGGFDPEIRLCEDVDFFGRAMREFGGLLPGPGGAALSDWQPIPDACPGAERARDPAPTRRRAPNGGQISKRTRTP